MRYKLIVGGGTFDHFHDGHGAFLRSMLSLSDQVLLGLTSDAYVQRRKSESGDIQPYEERLRQVRAFLEQAAAAERVTIEPIDDELVPAKWQSLPIEAIVVTEDTVAGAKAINDSREGRPPLAIVTVDTLTNESGERISATAIRAGKIDTDGRPYFPESWRAKNFVLPDSQRQAFREPFGELFATMHDLPMIEPERLVTVGDAVTKAGNRLGLVQRLSIVDYKVGRRVCHRSIKDLGFEGDENVLPANNPPGHITPSLTGAIADALTSLPENRRLIIKVTGEEDLAVIPSVLLLPLGYKVLYGQPGQGVVLLDITPAAKYHARELLNRFEVTAEKRSEI